MPYSGRVLLVVAALVVPPVAAQGPGAAFGAVIGGPTLSELAGGPGIAGNRWGSTVGLLLGFNVARAAIGLEGNWIQKGSGATQLEYIEVPLTVGAVVLPGPGPLRGRLYTGVSVGFKVGCRSAILVCGAAEGTEWSWPVGVQFGSETEKGSFLAFDLRYSMGLSESFGASGLSNRAWLFRAMIGRRLSGATRR